MNIVAIGSTAGQFHKDRSLIEEELRKDGHEVFFIFRKSGDEHNIMSEIRSYEPDILITEDLEGFEMCTLTDAVSYNLIHCRQFHVIGSGVHRDGDLYEEKSTYRNDSGGEDCDEKDLSKEESIYRNTSGGRDHEEIIPNERFLGKQLSLVMTFVCTDEGMAQRLKTAYSDLPEVVKCDDTYLSELFKLIQTV